MKHTLYKILAGACLLSFSLSSCTKDFQELNTDPNNIPNAVASQLLAPALVNTLAANMSRNRNFNNELMQVTVNMSDAEGQVFRYDFRSNWSDYLYNAWYSELTNFKDMYRIAKDSLTLNTSYQGISLICQSYVYSLLTDTYGDIPYFKSNMAKDSFLFEPPFDRQKDIYMDIFSKLEQANTLLTANVAITSGSDPVYNGNVSRWRKFGNSLYLRLLMRISGKTEVTDTVKAMFKKVATTYPIIASNDESAILRFTGVPPYISPLVSVREQDFRAPGIASYFIDNLVAWNDPRIDIPTYGSGTPTKTNRWAIAPFSGVYQGVPSGYSPGDNPVKKCYFYSMTNNTNTGPSLQTEPMAGMILNFAEVRLMLAEAVVKGWITGTAQTYYNDGAYASIRQWLPTWPGVIQDWLTAADMEWDETLTLDEKMERIHKQKYYALFLCDMQQWFEYRRTGHPILPKGTGLRNNGVMPARMPYPVYVQSTNPTNYKLAVAAQGADNMSTQVWWQKP